MKTKPIVIEETYSWDKFNYYFKEINYYKRFSI